MKNTRLTKNPFLLFLPFLLFYVIFVIVLNNNALWSDEVRHIYYTNNLLHGFYSPPAPDIKLEIGPGYPLLLLPFIALHLPLITIKLLNAILLYLSIVLLFKVLIKFVSFKTTLIVSLFWACYYNSLDYIALIYSEVLSAFLITALVFLLTKAFNPDTGIKTNKSIYLAGFVLGFLALTKIIFGYVLVCMLIVCTFLWILNRKAVNYHKGIIILLISFTTVLPYLAYTYHLTGRVFYWGTSGGLNLYPMTSPDENEYGSYIAAPYRLPEPVGFEKGRHNNEDGGLLNLKNRSNNTTGYMDSIIAHHLKNYDEIYKYTGVERDDAYKKIAMNNIKNHPVKYVQNCLSNIGRILFNYPFSYTLQKPGTLLRLPLNGIVVVLSLFCIIPTLSNWKRIEFSMRFMLFIVLLYLGGSVFGSAEIRMFTVIIPILLLWIAFVLKKSIKINITEWDK